MGIIKSSIKDQLYHMLKEKILKQELKLGEQLNPKEIAAANEVSVMPVRDALLRLVNQGLVINKPRVGFYVKRFSRSEVEDIMEVRTMYELFCIRDHFTSIDHTKLIKIKQAININNEDLTRQEFDRIDLDLHYSIILGSGNQFLIKHYNKIKDLLILFQHLNLQRIRQAHQEHKDIVDGIINQNQAQAERGLQDHLKKVTSSILANMS